MRHGLILERDRIRERFIAIRLKPLPSPKEEIRLTPTEVKVLVAARKRSGGKIVEIAKVTGVQKSHVSEALDGLAGKGLLTRGVLGRPHLTWEGFELAISLSSDCRGL